MGAGRPLKYKSAKELEVRIEKYWEDCQKNYRPYTMSGLALALGIDRKTLLNYSNKEEYFPTIKKARDTVEAFNEEQLYTGKNTAGVIFSLKNNFGWHDKVEQDVKVKASIEDYFRENKLDA